MEHLLLPGPEITGIMRLEDLDTYRFTVTEKKGELLITARKVDDEELKPLAVVGFFQDPDYNLLSLGHFPKRGGTDTVWGPISEKTTARDLRHVLGEEVEINKTVWSDGSVVSGVCIEALERSFWEELTAIVAFDQEEPLRDSQQVFLPRSYYASRSKLYVPILVTLNRQLPLEIFKPDLKEVEDVSWLSPFDFWESFLNANMGEGGDPRKVVAFANLLFSPGYMRNVALQAGREGDHFAKRFAKVYK